MSSQQHTKVTCGIIERDSLILAAQRSEAMSLPLKWEFPGGKLRAGETPQACLVRELREELQIEVEVLRALPASPYRYCDKAIELLPFVCRIAAGEIELMEHKSLRWGRPDDLLSLDWAPADVPVLQSYILSCKDFAPGN